MVHYPDLRGEAAHHFTLRVSSVNGTRNGYADTKEHQNAAWDETPHIMHRQRWYNSGMENKLLYRDEVYAIQGAIFDVYREMGNAWHEEVYQQCLERELKLRSIPFEAKKELPIFYKGEKIEKTYIPDLFCFGKIILELKAIGQLGNEHRAQLLNYLRITKCKLGLLVNFGAYPRADIQRYAL